MTTPLPNLFFDGLESSREGEDIKIIHGFSRNDQDKLTVMAFLADVDLVQRWEIVSNLIGDPTTVELIWGMDRYSRPGQGVETKSLITFYHWDKTYAAFGGWRFGVVPYDANGCHVAIYDHPFWTSVQRIELSQQITRADERSFEYLARLGFPPEAHAILMDELKLADERGEKLELSASTGRQLLDRVRARLNGEPGTRVH